MRWQPAIVLLLVSTLAGCAVPPSEPTPATTVPDRVECGPELATVFSAETYGGSDVGEFFRVFAATKLPDGPIVISFDPDTPGAGDESKQSDPRLVELGSDGSVRPVEVPPIDGLPVSAGAQPIAADSSGVLYVFDDANSRVIARRQGDWQLVAPIPSEATFGFPKGMIGPDGALYLVLTTAVVRVDDDGQLTRVVGVSARGIGDISFPEPVARGVPGPALSATLSLLSGAALLEDGTMLVTSQAFLYAVSPSGLMTVLIATEPLEDRQVVVLPPGSDPLSSARLSGVAVGVDGAVFIADTGQQRLLRLSDSRLSVVLEKVSGIQGDVQFGDTPESELLLIRNGGEVLCAYVP